MANSGKTKICKYCKSEIAADAKICPHCRKKQGGKLKWIIIGLVVLCFIGAASGGGNKSPQKVESKEAVSNNATTAKKEEPTTQAAPTTFGIGDTADFNGIQVRLSSAILSKGDGQFIKPDDGKYFLALIFDIVNQSSSDISVSSMVSFEAYCDDYAVNLDILGYQAPEVDGLNQLDGSVAAGKRMNGVICYQVPKDFSNFEINYSPSFWGNKKATFTFTNNDVDTSAIK